MKYMCELSIIFQEILVLNISDNITYLPVPRL